MSKDGILVGNMPSSKKILKANLQEYQALCGDWLEACLGIEQVESRFDRGCRFLEEALELIQATGDLTANHAHMLVDEVFSRPAGVVSQEVGGTALTLALLCNAHGIDLEYAAKAELARVCIHADTIRTKNAAKPKMSPHTALPYRSKLMLDLAGLVKELYNMLEATDIYSPPSVVTQSNTNSVDLSHKDAQVAPEEVIPDTTRNHLTFGIISYGEKSIGFVKGDVVLDDENKTLVVRELIRMGAKVVVSSHIREEYAWAKLCGLTDIDFLIGWRSKIPTCVAKTAQSIPGCVALMEYNVGGQLPTDLQSSVASFFPHLVFVRALADVYPAKHQESYVFPAGAVAALAICQTFDTLPIIDAWMARYNFGKCSVFETRMLTVETRQIPTATLPEGIYSKYLADLTESECDLLLRENINPVRVDDITVTVTRLLLATKFLLDGVRSNI